MPWNATAAWSTARRSGRWRAWSWEGSTGSRGGKVAKQQAGPLKVAGRIDPEGHGVNQPYPDAHAVLESAQLLELLALLKGARR